MVPVGTQEVNPLLSCPSDSFLPETCTSSGPSLFPAVGLLRSVVISKVSAEMI